MRLSKRLESSQCPDPKGLEFRARRALKFQLKIIFSRQTSRLKCLEQEEKIRLVTQQIIVKSNFRPKGVSMLNGSSSETSDGPTTVFVNLFVRSFEKIDDVKMEFSVQITFRQQWNDNRQVNISRLGHIPISLCPSLKGTIEPELKLGLGYNN